MRRTLFVAVVVGAILAFSTHALAMTHASRRPRAPSQSPAVLLVMPLKLFVAVSHAPAVAVGKSVTAILRHVLLGHGRTKGMPVRQMRQARI